MNTFECFCSVLGLATLTFSVLYFIFSIPGLFTKCVRKASNYDGLVRQIEWVRERSYSNEAKFYDLERKLNTLEARNYVSKK